MTKARILADYVAGGVIAAEHEFMDGVTSNVQTQLTAKAPKASPAFTGTPTGITAAHLEAGVLPSDVTGGSGLTELGTVTAGNISNSAIVYPAGHVVRTSETHDLDNAAHIRTTSSTQEPSGIIVASLATTGSNYNIINFYASGWMAGGTNHAGLFQLYADKNGAGYSTVHATQTQHVFHDTEYTTFQHTWIDSSGLTLGTNNYQIYFKSGSGDEYFYMIHSGHGYGLIVQEIQV